MTQPNPFATPASSEPQQAPNPFGAAAAPVQQQAPATAPNPFGQPQQTAPAPVQAYVPPAPQAYAPAPSYQPAPQQWTQQQAAPAPQAYAQQTPPAPPAGAAPPMIDPNSLRAAGAPPASYSKGPELPDMYGRLVIIFPQDVVRVPRNAKYVTDQDRASGNLEQDRMTATIVILDSGQGTPAGQGVVSWGGAPHALPPTPHTNHDPLPYVIKGKWVSQSKLIDQCRPYLPQHPGAAPGMLAGRMVKRGPAHNDPWYLLTATDQELETARQYLSAVAGGHLPHPLAA